MARKGDYQSSNELLGINSSTNKVIGTNQSGTNQSGNDPFGKDPFANPQSTGSTDTLTRPVEQEDDGGHDRFAHYIKKEKIVESAVTGKAVKALCGKKWVPSRDPSKYPVCPMCKEIFEGLRPGPEDNE